MSRPVVTDAMIDAACARFVSESDNIWSTEVWPEGPEDDGNRGGGRVRLISETDQHDIRAAMRFALQDAVAASPATHLDIEAINVALSQAKRGADKAGCDGWRAQEMCRQIVQLLEKALERCPDGLKSSGQRAFERMRDNNDNASRAMNSDKQWSDLSEAERKAWDDDATERPFLYGLPRRAASPVATGRNTNARAFSIDDLAQEIRRVDGNHDLGAGALAEALMPFLSRFGVGRE